MKTQFTFHKKKLIFFWGKETFAMRPEPTAETKLFRLSSHLINPPRMLAIVVIDGMLKYVLHVALKPDGR